MFRRSILSVATLVGVLAATSSSAHHGWSGYDSNKVLTLTGSMVKVDYRNPHVMIDLKAGEKTWNVVLAPLWRMTNRGLPEGSLKPGASATVVGYPNKSEESELRAERITIDGKTVELR